jgi:hypothetical protein
MNDFTKEELILVACWSFNRYEQVGDDQAQDEGTIRLSHKIQDMIVNHCEHKKTYPGHDRCSKCADCGREFY